MPWGEFLAVIGQVAIVVVLLLILAAMALGLRDAFRGKTHDDDEAMERLVAMDDPRRDGAL